MELQVRVLATSGDHQWNLNLQASLSISTPVQLRYHFPPATPWPSSSPALKPLYSLFAVFALWQNRSSVQSQTYQREFADLDIQLKDISISNSGVLSGAVSVTLEVNLQPVPLQLQAGVAAVVHLIYTCQRRCQRPYRDLAGDWFIKASFLKNLFFKLWIKIKATGCRQFSAQTADGSDICGKAKEKDNFQLEKRANCEWEWDFQHYSVAS